MRHRSRISFTLMAAVAALLFSMESVAQNRLTGTDSIVFRQSAALDSALVGKSIFNILNGGQYGSGDVRIHQSQTITDAMRRHIDRNPSRTLSGYRVRIFFDNSQTARNASEQVVKKFALRYPGVPAYRSYQNPFFKVAVGDFRTKSEAMEFLQKVKSAFPAAFVVKEPIEFPAPDRKHTYTIDTVKVARAL